MKKAFTLIEMLVAVFLLSLLFTLIFYLFKLYIVKIDNFKLSLPKKAFAYELLDRNIKGYYPYLIKDKYFINYTKNSITYVSTNPLYYHYIVVSQIECINNQLLYKETLLYKKNLNYLNLKNIKFTFILPLLSYNKNCIINKTLEKDNFLKSITLNIDKQKWFFTTLSKWKDLKGILKAKENIR